MPELSIGLFLILLAIGFLSFLVARQFGSIFKLLGVVVFFSLSIMMFGLTDIVYATQSVNATGHIQSTDTVFLLGDGDDNTDDAHIMLGYIFTVMAILMVITFLFDMFKGKV